MKNRRNYGSFKKMIRILLVLFLFSVLFGCQSSSSSSSSDDEVVGDPTTDATTDTEVNEFTAGDSVVMTTADGSAVTGTVVDLDGDGELDGIDLNDDATTLEFVFIDDSSSAASGTNIAMAVGTGGIFAVDTNGDGTIDFYLHVQDFSTGTVALNTSADGTGTTVTVLVDSSGAVIGVDTDGDGTADITVISVSVLNDSTAPTPGGSGAITVTGVTNSSLKLSWAKAADNSTPAVFLRYKVIQSTGDNLGTINDATTTGSGRSVIQDWVVDIAEMDITSLNPVTTYYFVVLVADAKGNTAIYQSKSQETEPLSLTGSWTSVGGSSNSILNFDETGDATKPQLMEHNSDLYAIWSEINVSGYYRIRVKEWDETQWTFIDGNTEAGINYDTNTECCDGDSPQLTSFNSNLYAAWQESDGRFTHTRVKEWNGSSWSFIDGGEAAGINYAQFENAFNPQLATHNSTLYAIWGENYTSGATYRHIRVREWNGDTTWTFRDGGNTDSGLNYNAYYNAYNPQLTSFNSKLYAIWSEEVESSIYQIRVKQWNGGSSWSFIDDDDSDAETGLNYIVNKAAYEPQLTVYNSKLYAIWAENYGTPSVKQIRVREWDGTNWTFIDGNSDTGMNYNISHTASNPQLTSFNSLLYATWNEFDDNSNYTYTVRVNEWDGTQWRFVDGNTAPGLTNDVPTSQHPISPQLTEYQSNLYFIWDEGNSTATGYSNKLQKIRVKKALME
jgi:hypothetical protein